MGRAYSNWFRTVSALSQNIDKTRLLILVCVTDLDTDEQFQAIDEYQETKEVAAQLLVDKSQLISQSLNTVR